MSVVHLFVWEIQFLEPACGLTKTKSTNQREVAMSTARLPNRKVICHFLWHLCSWQVHSWGTEAKSVRCFRRGGLWVEWAAAGQLTPDRSQLTSASYSQCNGWQYLDNAWQYLKIFDNALRCKFTRVLSLLKELLLELTRNKDQNLEDALAGAEGQRNTCTVFTPLCALIYSWTSQFLQQL